MSDEKGARYFVVIVFIAILIALAVIFLANSGSFGLTGQAQDVLNKEIESESGGNIHLADFRKTDGQSGEVLGVKVYNLQFEGEITFSSGGVWVSQNGPSLTFNFSKTPLGAGYGMLYAETRVHPDDHVKIAGAMTGQKSENGWNFTIGECHLISQ
jgi:archaellum component FlaF (FlaF/FlaG flagellin family)